MARMAWRRHEKGEAAAAGDEKYQAIVVDIIWYQCDAISHAIDAPRYCNRA